jgi:hypothetical protein
MRTFAGKRGARNGESGYALVMILFFLALLVLSTVTAAPTVISNIQREKEAEMVWRGKQYTRGIHMYYMKMHRFPTSLEDLTKPKMAGIRFMRQAYKDPMNGVDGSWRLIYVGPSGQLIGSFMNRSFGFGGQFGAPAVAGQGAGSSFFNNANSGLGTGAGASSFNTSLQGNSATSGMNQFGANPASGATTTTLQNTSSPADPNAQNPDAPEDPGQPHSIAAPLDSSNVIGGNIIGVGSKVNRKSFLWYEKAKNYRQFEFIWDPSKDFTVGGASRGIGTPIQNGAPGVSTPPPNQGVNPVTPVTPDPSNNPPLQAPPNQ